MGRNMGIILVTGGAGFIGSHLLRRLEGKEKRVLDNLTTGTLRNIKGINVKFIKGDIRRKKTVEECARGVETIFHLAANTFPVKSIQKPFFDLATNVEGTLNLLEAARKNDVERFIFSSSAAIYGDVRKTPIREDSTPAPRSPYGIDKLACEHYVKIYYDLYGMKTISLRYFTVYGERQNPKSPYSSVVSRFLYNVSRGVPLEIQGNGLQKRDFVNVKDVVEANVCAMKSSAWGSSINIGTGKPTSIISLARMILKLRNVGMTHREAREGDIKASIADIKLALKVLGFNARISLSKGISELWKEEYSLHI